MFGEKVPSSELVLAPARGKSRSSLCLMRVLATVAILATPAASVDFPRAMTPVSVNTGSSGPTYIGKDMKFAIDSFEYSGSKNYTALVTKNPDINSKDLTVLKIDGTLVANSMVDPPGGPKFFDEVWSVVLKDPLKLFIPECSGDHLKVYLIQESAGVSSLIKDFEHTNFGNDGVSMGINDQSSVYIYYAGRSGNEAFGRFDMSAYQDNVNTGMGEDCIGLGFFGSNTIVYYKYDSNYIRFYQMSDLSFLDWKNSPYQYREMLQNNLNGNYMYLHRKVNGAQSVVSKADITQTIAHASDMVAEHVTLGGCDKHNLINFGPYQYLGFLCFENGRQLTAIDKLTWPSSSAGLPQFNFDSSMTDRVDSYDAAPTSFRFSDGVRFGFFESSTRNFQSYYLTFSSCLNRDGSNVCQQCIANFYRENLLPDNDCIELTGFPAGYGADNSTWLMTSCVNSPNCQECLYDYTFCTKCDTSVQFYLDTAAGQCVHIDNIPDGKGPNAAAGNILPCAKTNCSKCKNSYLVCQLCDIANDNYLNTATGDCVYLTNIAAGYGVHPNGEIIQACQVTACLECQSSSTICTRCDHALQYYLLVSSGLCYHTSSMPTWKGPNLTTKVIESCVDNFCKSCRFDKTLCVNCDTDNGYFLNTTGANCVSIPDIPLGKGADFVNGVINDCTIAGCINCRSDYTLCSGCNTASGYYLNATNGQCIHTSLIIDYFGANILAGTIENCVDQYCIKCSNNNIQCQACKTVNDYFLDTSSGTCTHKSQFPDFLGADLITGTIQACNTPFCKVCSASVTVCEGCDIATGYFLNSNTSECVTMVGIPPGFGPDLTEGVIKACADSNCLQCHLDFQVCILCDTSKQTYLENQVCNPAASAPAGMGIDLSSSLLQSCAVEFCEDCRKDHTKCSMCYESMGYYLEGNVCFLVDGFLNVKKDSQAPASIDIRVISGLEKELLVKNVDVYSELKNQINWKFVFTRKSNKLVEQGINFKQTTESNPAGVSNNLKFISLPSEKSYIVSVSSKEKYYNTTIDGKLYRIKGFSGAFEYSQLSTAGEVASAKSTGGGVNNAMGNSLTSSKSALPIMMAIVALDPTGVLMKFNQILKIINKLYFININYGKRLSAFLLELGSTANGGINKDQRSQVLYMSKYRGKLSQEQVSFDFIGVMDYKIPMYMAAWLITSVNYVISQTTMVSKWYLYVMYWWPKFHLIIFNLVFIDFIWFGCHTLLHSAGQTWLMFATTGVSIFLVAVDFYRVLDYFMNDKDWLYWVNVKKILAGIAELEKKKMHFESMRQLRQNKVADKNQIKQKEKKKPKQRRKLDDPNDDSIEDYLDKFTNKGAIGSKDINYQKTYDELASNYHFHQLMAFNLRLLKSVYLKPLARSIYFNHVCRIVAYQALIQTGQYCSWMVVILLLLMEIAKVVYSVLFYRKYKYLKNIICLLMEVMQSVFLSAFLIIAVTLCPKRFDETILDFYQDAGIWIVIASCVAEYLLLLTYIGVAAYDFFKNRKALSRAKKAIRYSFIKYGGYDRIRVMEEMQIMERKLKKERKAQAERMATEGAPLAQQNGPKTEVEPPLSPTSPKKLISIYDKPFNSPLKELVMSKLNQRSLQASKVLLSPEPVDQKPEADEGDTISNKTEIKPSLARMKLRHQMTMKQTGKNIQYSPQKIGFQPSISTSESSENFSPQIKSSQLKVSNSSSRQTLLMKIKRTLTKKASQVDK